MTRPKIETQFRKAVKQAIAEKHAAGLPAYQGIDGYLVAIYPGGKRVKLKKLANQTPGVERRDTAAADSPRRPKRRR